jgi:hypothetical protein
MAGRAVRSGKTQIGTLTLIQSEGVEGVKCKLVARGGTMLATLILRGDS